MKINRLETHDRLLHFKKDQSLNIAQGAEDCLKKNPLSLALQAHSPYIYIWAHPRTADDGVTKRMLWQPRLTKPEPQTNSYLFRAISNTDMLEVCWMLPPRETWGQYKKGLICDNECVRWSIDQFTNNRERMGMPEKDDLPEEICQDIYRRVVTDLHEQERMKKIYNLSDKDLTDDASYVPVDHFPDVGK